MYRLRVSSVMLIALVIVCAAGSALAGPPNTKAAQRAARPSMTSFVWTNEEIEMLRASDVPISFFGQTTPPAIDHGPTGLESYDRTRDPAWYARQAVILRAEISKHGRPNWRNIRKRYPAQRACARPIRVLPWIVATRGSRRKPASRTCRRGYTKRRTNWMRLPIWHSGTVFRQGACAGKGSANAKKACFFSLGTACSVSSSGSPSRRCNLTIGSAWAGRIHGCAS